MIQRIQRACRRRAFRRRGGVVVRGARLPRRLQTGSTSRTRLSAVWIEDGVRLNIGNPSGVREQLSLEDSSYINRYSVIDYHESIKIGRDILVGPHTFICDFDLDVGASAGSNVAAQCKRVAVRIEDDAWLGAGVRVLKRVTIGKGAIIGASAVVVKDVPPMAIAVGIPARVVRMRGDEESSSPLSQGRAT